MKYLKISSDSSSSGELEMLRVGCAGTGVKILVGPFQPRILHDSEQLNTFFSQSLKDSQIAL